ncbi:MarR family winged helix-turn-helix transcriptional regulator [Sphingopyxis alaskensis]|jgi:DNA-binding MarR family transcriptional regulator|uniref:Transcriptional regulator, MarR family n=1 Tax=Sphingopyxis alaskensis (strain DSM 13593 / LMG 18877 / RB2256) TaxID=317655 RepID=Q1GUU2_SPHAL|nr:MarR family transcriptional regulator [Sphingopyxis alaskensis]ABF52580.1 transcriptional regulator, MarR family [Sphingopyxis alaskensis RB2256]MCM3418114.1 MarR family transcriptional regulator [Sphingopyxis alaskensis]
MSPRFSDFERFADELARLRGRMRALYADTRAQSGLAEMELTVLTAVVNAATPPTVAQIGRSLGHPRQVVQRAANRLAALDLIDFADNPDHKRASLIIATDAGRALKAADHDRAQAVTTDILARIDGEMFADAADRLQEIRQGIETYLRARDR